MRGAYFAENGIMEGIPTDVFLIYQQYHPRRQLKIKTFYYFKIEIQHFVFQKKNSELGVSLQGCSFSLEISLHINQFIFIAQEIFNNNKISCAQQSQGCTTS
jgi:hypothetical protein